MAFSTKALITLILTFVFVCLCVPFSLSDPADGTADAPANKYHGSHHDKKHRPGDPDDSHFDDKSGEHNEDFDHEAITGSHKLAEEFKELSPEEAKKRLSVLVDRMDADQDGCVQRPELTNWILHSFNNLDKENTKQKMEELDENKDNKITWIEYVHKNYGYTQKDVEDLKKDKSPDMVGFIEMLDDDHFRFELADLNKDGVMDLEEFNGFMHPQNNDHMAEFEMRRTLHDFDKNKDGSIDFKEFLGGDIAMDNESLTAEKKHFEEFDTNKDGKLDKEEMKPWMMPGYTGTAKSETTHLFTETDDNKDDKLCKDEILKHHELWVGSHATDYGKHLDDMAKDEL